VNQQPPEPPPAAGALRGDGEYQIQQELGTTERAARFYEEQVRDRLNTRMREFIGRQEMFFLSTADGTGECDCTFRAGPPGFVLVLDEKTVAYPEYRGNGVMASLGNIRENPHVGILMVDFGRDRVGLHVNGRARIVPDELMRAWTPDLPIDPVPGRRAQVWVEVDIEEAYIHCSKHIPQLVKVPRAGGAGRAWGTDDSRHKGGDYFGSAAELRAARAATGVTGDRTGWPAGSDEEGERAAAVPEPAEPVGDRIGYAVLSERTDRAVRAGLPDPDIWRREAERALARAHQRGGRATADTVPGGQGGGFRGWFG
jgi:uncharacterized protein